MAPGRIALEVPGMERKKVSSTQIRSVGYDAGAQTLSRPLHMRKPVTRVENYCATGTEAFRGACYAVASGAVDIALALGVFVAAFAGLLAFHPFSRPLVLDPATYLPKTLKAT